MLKDIFLPKVSMGQTEGSITEWLVEEGSWVEKDQMIMVMETEKVAYELESPFDGFIVFKIALSDIVPCGSVVAVLAETKEEYEQLKNQDTNGKISVESNNVNKTNTKGSLSNLSIEESVTVLNSENKKVLITPVAKKKCTIHNIDISLIQGTGPRGRIQNRDVEKYLADCKEQEKINIRQQKDTLVEENIDKRVKTSIPYTGMRKAIADSVMMSLQNTAQLSWSAEIDMTNILVSKKKWNSTLSVQGDKVSLNDILLFAMVKAIKYVPQVNSSLVGNEIKIWENVNLGFAAAMKLGEYDYGLVVPIIKNAQTKSLLEISRKSKELIDKSRNGKLTKQDLTGGTITMSNNGSMGPGWRISTPVLVYPQAVLVQPCGIEKRPVVINDEIVIRTIMPVSYTFDHRILDGVPMYNFHTKLKEVLENPEYLVL